MCGELECKITIAFGQVGFTGHCGYKHISYTNSVIALQLVMCTTMYVYTGALVAIQLPISTLKTAAFLTAVLFLCDNTWSCNC